MSSRTRQALRLYRDLFRCVEKETAVKGNTIWLNHFRTKFRQGAKESDSKSIDILLKSGQNTLAYVRDLDNYQNLLEEYNIGVQVDERERIKKTAAAVGLGIPEFYEDGGEDPAEKYRGKTE